MGTVMDNSVGTDWGVGRGVGRGGQRGGNWDNCNRIIVKIDKKGNKNKILSLKTNSQKGRIISSALYCHSRIVFFISLWHELIN